MNTTNYVIQDRKTGRAFTRDWNFALTSKALVLSTRKRAREILALVKGHKSYKDRDPAIVQVLLAPVSYVR